MSALESFYQSVEFSPIVWLPVDSFCERFGVTRAAVKGKIRDRKWICGKEYIRDPDGKLHINVVNYQKWVESEWLRTDEKEAQYQRTEEGSTSRSTGTTQKRDQSKNIVGPSRHVKKKLKVID